MELTININGEPVTRDVEPRKLLVHYIRETPGLTGTHWGCDSPRPTWSSSATSSIPAAT
jgi:aerobic carbon-monoxide dehydrogenase small subunit